VLDSTSTLAGTSGRSAQDCYCARGAVGGAKNGVEMGKITDKSAQRNGVEMEKNIDK